MSAQTREAEPTDLGLGEAAARRWRTPPRRGKKIRTTLRDDGHERAADLARRDFTASLPE
nr:hypothetical protein StreXyl84_62590 [Streptomyces sp. Xyl84]